MAVCLASLSATAQTATTFKINGTCPSGVAKVYVINVEQRGETLDSVSVNDGKFAITGKAGKDAVLGLTTDKHSYAVFINDGQPLTADMQKMSLKGSALNEKLNGYDRTIDSLSREISKYGEQYNKAVAEGKSEQELKSLKDELISKYINPLQDQIVTVSKNAVKDNLDNMIPTVFIGNIIYDTPFAELKQLFDPKHAYTHNPLAKQAQGYMKSIEAKEALVGKPFMDITLNDTEGKAHKLSEYLGKGNYVLIDFWASWCGPCRAEMPNVKANYDKYHTKGFNIVGISLDRNAEAWKKGIADLKADWIHLSDLKFWQSAAARLYSIRSIPASFLVGPKGNIIAYDLRDNALGEKLKSIYGF